jgi:hypothetical protein
MCMIIMNKNPPDTQTRWKEEVENKVDWWIQNNQLSPSQPNQLRSEFALGQSHGED